MSWIEMRGCLDTGTRIKASPHAFSRHCNNADTCMAACVRGLVSARFQKGKDTDPLPKASCLLSCVGASVQCTRGRSHAARDKDTALYIKQKSRTPKVVSMRARREMTLLQEGLHKCNSVTKAKVSGGRRAIAVAASQFLMQKARRASSPFFLLEIACPGFPLEWGFVCVCVCA